MLVNHVKDVYVQLLLFAIVGNDSLLCYHVYIGQLSLFTISELYLLILFMVFWFYLSSSSSSVSRFMLLRTPCFVTLQRDLAGSSSLDRPTRSLDSEDSLDLGDLVILALLGSEEMICLMDSVITLAGSTDLHVCLVLLS